MSIDIDSGTIGEGQAFSSARPNLWVATGAGIVAALASLYLSVFSDGAAVLLYLVAVVAPLSLIIFLAMFVRPWRQEWPTIVCALAAFFISTWVGFRLFPRYRFDVRWFVTASDYKREVLMQPVPASGQLRHTEWDGWGFVPSGNTVVYVVYDPSNSLLESSKPNAHMSVSGLPCDVSRVKRLEENWYAVVFYTDTDWEHCPSNP